MPLAMCLALIDLHSGLSPVRTCPCRAHVLASDLVNHLPSLMDSSFCVRTSRPCVLYTQSRPSFLPALSPSPSQSGWASSKRQVRSNVGERWRWQRIGLDMRKVCLVEFPCVHTLTPPPRAKLPPSHQIHYHRPEACPNREVLITGGGNSLTFLLASPPQISPTDNQSHQSISLGILFLVRYLL